VSIYEGFYLGVWDSNLLVSVSWQFVRFVVFEQLLSLIADSQIL